MPTGYVQISLSQLRAGTRLHAPILDGQSNRGQLLLLAAGAKLTEKQLELLRRRGITQVLVHQSDVEDATGGKAFSPVARAGRKAADSSPRQMGDAARFAESRKPPSVAWKQSAGSFLNAVPPPQTLPHDPNVVLKATRAYSAALTSTKNIFEEFAQTQRINSSSAIGVAEQQLIEAARDLDVHTSLAAQPVVEGYPSRHSLQTSMLAVSIGTIMGLNKDELIELSLGCLLHDAGMMLVPQRIVAQQGPLSASDRLEVLKHPLHIANALSRRKDIPHASKATAYQIHERLNGSGYPRQRQHPQIHLFARIGAVADTYLTMISPRNGRTGLSPYDAVEKILYATRLGLFDPSVVRALLHAASLFPVGSKVRLSDGRIGRVTRSNRERYDRPVIEIPPTDFDEPPELINLSEHEFLSVIGAGESVAVEV